MTFDTLLARHGWDQVNLFENDLDLSRMTIWAHITDPHQRHTKGVEQYLRLNPDLNIDEPAVGKMLVSGVFDEHTYSLSMMLGCLWSLPINWIPLDQTITRWNQHPVPPDLLDGDALTNDFFQENHLAIVVTKKDHLNKAPGNRLDLRDKINHLKSIYAENYNKLVKNFLEMDLLLYHRVVAQYSQKYS